MLTQLVANLWTIYCYTTHDIPGSSLSDVSITSASETLLCVVLLLKPVRFVYPHMA